MKRFGAGDSVFCQPNAGVMVASDRKVSWKTGGGRVKVKVI